MQNTRLITLLKTFSVQEMKDFEKFIASPYFSPGRNLIPLYNTLRKFYPDFESSQLTKESIFRKLFPGKKFDKKKSAHVISVMLSELLSLAEKFIAIELLMKEKDGYRIYDALYTSFSIRNIHMNREKLILNNIEKIHKSVIDDKFFREMFKLNSELLIAIFENTKFHKFTDHHPQELFECTQKMDLYNLAGYFSELTGIVNDYIALKPYNEIQSNLRIINLFIQNFDPELFEKDYYDDGLGTKQHILINFYLLKSQLKKEDEESPVKAIEYYKNNFNRFSRIYKYGFFENILNMCIARSVNQPQLKFYLIASQFIDFAIEKLYTKSEKNNLSVHYYILFFGIKNTVLNPIELNSFTDVILELTEPENKQWLYDYSYAWINFKKRDYEGTLKLISKIGILPSNLKNLIIKLKILSLYSLNYIEEAISNLNSYEHFCRDFIAAGETIYNFDLNFIRSVRLLIKYKTNIKTFDEHNLDNTLMNFKNHNLTPWFKEEAEKIKKAGLKPAS